MVKSLLDLTRDELLKLVGLFVGNVLVHYGMWFTETAQKLGLQKTLELEHKAFLEYGPIALNKLTPHLKSHETQDMLLRVSQKSQGELIALISALAKTWVASDGVWFQAVEDHCGMDVAKEINDRCWAHFAAMEATKIRRFLALDPGCGLGGLQNALEFRTYSVINAHSSDIQSDGSLLLTIQECRVQNSRRRKNMEDYPCKSAGFIEYSNFATFVDPRIVTECVYCPPDPVAPHEFCSWRFKIE